MEDLGRSLGNPYNSDGFDDPWQPSAAYLDASLDSRSQIHSGISYSPVNFFAENGTDVDWVDIPWYGGLQPFTPLELDPLCLASPCNELEDMVECSSTIHHSGDMGDDLVVPLVETFNLDDVRRDTVGAEVIDEFVVLNNVTGSHSEDRKSMRQNQRVPTTVDSCHDPALVCLICGMTFQKRSDLTSHSGTSGHRTVRCQSSGCDFVYTYVHEYSAHNKIQHPDKYTCNECRMNFPNQWDLANHRSKTGHALIVCDFPDCEKEFSRQDTYSRHKSTHYESAKRHPCKYCRKYRGSNGFKRKDHLQQHIRGYHHIQDDQNNNDTRFSYCYKACHHTDCASHWSRESGWENRPFKYSKDYVKHMRESHDESDFPCPRPGCDRIGAKGYFRAADLRAHLKKVHNIANAAIENINQ